MLEGCIDLNRNLVLDFRLVSLCIMPDKGASETALDAENESISREGLLEILIGKNARTLSTAEPSRKLNFSEIHDSMLHLIRWKFNIKILHLVE